MSSYLLSRCSISRAAGRSFSTSSSPRASVLFALGALSNSRETQHFNKLSRLQRIEHSPPLKLIKTGEIDPFPLPEPPKQSPPLLRSHVSRVSPAQIWDRKALQAGRTILSDNARRLSRMSKALERAKRRETKAKYVRSSELAAWAQERQKMRAEMRSAGIYILASVAVATALATWRFWPQNGEIMRDSGEMGRKIAERAQRAIPLPAARSVVEHTAAPVVEATQAAEAVAASALPVTGVSTPIVPAQTVVSSEQTRSWSKTLTNMFWKVQ